MDPMRVMLVTWDGAGNLPPALTLISALAERGHEVAVLGHDSQEPEIRQAGGEFLRFPSAPQLDQAKQQSPTFDFLAWFQNFNQKVVADFLAEAQRIDPTLVIVDCMLPGVLITAGTTGRKVIALVHGTLSGLAHFSGPISAADLALSCSYAELDQGMEFPANMVFVGPLRPVANGHGWTRKSPELPLVVASLSSGLQGPFQLDLLQRICDALSGLPVEGLVTTGRGIQPESLSAGANVTVARNVDHTLTLPAASLFVTHCGHGSVVAALRAGVPMLCVPPIADQPHNAELVRRLGLGEVVDLMSTPPVLIDAITRLIANQEMRSAARKFAEDVTYEPRCELAVDKIEALAR
jgi:UDP:flavonoid glycosyltransferase YjiC (YdhE family)